MTRISFNNNGNIMPYAGLMVTIVVGNMNFNKPTIPIPTENYSFDSVVYSIDEQPHLADYSYLRQASNMSNVILAVINSLIHEPSPLDLEMLSMLNYDIEELF